MIAGRSAKRSINGIIEYVCEIAGSLKIGKFMPGTQIPVVEESKLFTDQPECAVIFSWHIAERQTNDAAAAAALHLRP